MDTIQTKRGIKEYDIIKGIVIILVVLGHSYYIVSYGTTMEEFLSIDSNWIVKFFYTYVDKVIYSFHMPIYMIISGVLASYALCVKSQKEYIIDRFNRLMVSFILCGVLYAVPIKYISGFYYEWSLIKSYI